MLDILLYFVHATAKKSDTVKKFMELAAESDLYKEEATQAMLSGNTKAEAIAIIKLGNVQHELGYLKEAFTTYERGLSLAIRAGDKDVEASALCNLGQVHVDKLEYPQAYAYYSKAQALVSGGNEKVEKMIAEKIEMLDYMKKFDSLSKKREKPKE